MDWTVELTNVSASSLALHVSYPAGLTTGSAVGDLDSDGFIDPGEVWRWMLTTPITLDCSTLLLGYDVKGAASNFYGHDWHSDPVRIGSPTDACPGSPPVDQSPPVTSHITSFLSAQSPPTTSTTATTPGAASGVLPATGRSGNGSALFGACALFAGALLVLASRRRGHPVPD